MFRRARQPPTAWRHVFLTLAALALALKVVVPAGFMARGPSNDQPFAIVICTGQGAVTVAPGAALPGPNDPAQAPSKAHDSPCVYAGGTLGAPPPSMQAVEQVAFVAYRALVAPPPDLAPGRGLAGPPLPARGPPSLLV